LRLFSFGGYGLALAALALVVFGAYDSYPKMQPLISTEQQVLVSEKNSQILATNFGVFPSFFERDESAGGCSLPRKTSCLEERRISPTCFALLKVIGG